LKQQKTANIEEKPSPMFEYDCGSWGPKEADRLVDAVGGWYRPQPA